MTITSPCINVCVTDPNTDLCYGCSRTTKEIKESGFGLDNFVITDFSLDDSQNHYLLAEHISKISSKKETYWISKGFVVIKFNKNGNYIWGCPVPKNQKDEFS